MKTTGALWKEYLASWPEDWWYDYSDELFDGVEADEHSLNSAELSDTAEVEVTTGLLFKGDGDKEGVDLIRHFNAWKRSRSMCKVLVAVNRESLDALKAYVKTLKGTVTE